MSFLRTLLMVIGAATLLLLGSCVLGIGILGSALDPQSATATTDRSDAEVREAVTTYLDGARKGRFADRTRLDAMSDGSIRLNIGRSEPLDLTMSVAFEPLDKRVKVTATYNADHLAWSQADDVLSTNLHRCLRDDFENMIAEFHNGRNIRRLDLDTLMARARRSSREIGCAA